MQKLSHHGIGASEISAVVGMNPYASPWDIWLRKTGQAPDIEETEPMEWGHRLEPAIRQKYVDDTGAYVHVPNDSLFHAELKWARATPDGCVLADGARKDWASLPNQWSHLLQCKNVGTWVERAWADAPPPYVQLQEQWEMYVTGLSRADVAVLIGGNDFRIYTVHRDDKMIGDLVDIATEFWHRVESRVEPDIDESDACRDHFQRRLKANDVELVADAETESLMQTWRQLHLDAKRIDKETKRIRNVVLQHLADAQADRIVSSLGIAKIQTTGGKSTTNWKFVAEMLGAGNPDLFRELVAANTNTTDEKPTLYAPRTWAKENP